jgi:adenylate cyclase
MSDFPEGSPDPLVGGSTEGFRIEGPVCPADRAWRLVGDSDWMNRAAGAGTMSNFVVNTEEDGFAMLRGELAGPMGMTLPFREVWSSWVTGSFFRQIRDFESPIVARSDYRASLVPAGAPGMVRPVVDMRVTGPGWASMVRRGLSLAGMRRSWSAALERLNAPDADEVPTRTLGAEAVAALRRWERLADPEIVQRFDQHLRTARPTDVNRLRAFELADRWGVDRGQVLDVLVAGIEAGAVELFWSVRCSRCYGQVAGGRLLSDLADHAECTTCEVRTDVDLGANVEVLFAPHPTVESQADVNFCTVFPKSAPSQIAVLTLSPGQQVRAPLHLPPGSWALGAGRGRPDLEVEAGIEGDDTARWDSTRTGQVAVRSGLVTLDVHNDSPSRARLHLTRIGGALAMVPANLLTTRESFRRKLGHQVLAPGLRVGVRAVALVFTDLSGSTAMYEELGDARAFAVVRDHFTVLRQAAAAHNGTVVKTIGDAVMAAFFDAPAALAAAFEMVAAFDIWVATLGLEHPPALKVGVHVGSALVVHSDQAGLDYFGGAVNLAARAQGAAEAGEIVWTDAVQSMERAREVVAARGFVAAPMSKALKGLGEVRLWRNVREIPKKDVE